MKAINFFKLVLNPFRVISMIFLFFGGFWGYLADLLDVVNDTLINLLSNNKIAKSDIIKDIPIGEKIGKFIILLLLFCLIFIWINHLERMTL